MTKINTIIIVASAILFSVGLNSCNNAPYKVNNIRSEFASVTTETVSQMSSIYTEIEEVTIKNDFDNALAGILSKQENEYNPIDVVNTDIRYKIEIFNLYRIAINEYAKLANIESSITSLAPYANACNSIVIKFQECQDTTLENFGEKIKSYTKVPRFDTEKVMGLLVNSLKYIWQSDTKGWNDLLNNSFSDFQLALTNVPDASFNEEKLAKYVYQPYEGKHALVEAYKLNLIKERYDYIRKFVNSQDNISTAIEYLNTISQSIIKGKDTEKISNEIKKAEIALNECNFQENTEYKE
ncbi:MAG: hypothetical protein MJ211_06800 [Bacteroidales bacterium]|nr:hypothetical protein [Bacteroidales bacterium]